MSEQWVYCFHQGHAGMRELLGGKGAGLAEMTRAGLPVPPGFTITTEACRVYQANGRLTDELLDEIGKAVRWLEHEKGQWLADPRRPLLISVRSGAVDSMPGMMDTILNVGLNDETVAGLADNSSELVFAYDCYQRLVSMFGNVVMDVEPFFFEQKKQQLMAKYGYRSEAEVPARGWRELTEDYQDLIYYKTGRPFPQNVNTQLRMAIEAVFRSWNNPRAKVYRKVHGIPEDAGTAVNVQAMVFGNKGASSGTGVVFTRNPSTGDQGLYGEYLNEAQGEDVVSGVRTPRPIASLADEMPEVYSQLARIAEMLETHYADLQDIEFTVEMGKLYVLQTRGGKRSAQAAVKVAVDMANEGTISREQALMRIEPEHLDQLLHRTIDPTAKLDAVATGLPSSPGAACGQAVFHADTAERWAKEGRQTVLIRTETTPEDIHGVLAAQGVLTQRGGMTSHAAVVARGLGKPCICGCEALQVDAERRRAMIGEAVIEEGDWITFDGASGRIYRGQVPLVEAGMSEELTQLLHWADDIRHMRVMANADSPEDARRARQFGAEGVGLCRTEHMFMASERLPVVQRMILADSGKARAEALAELLPMQQADFAGLFREMDGLPVTIRLLDPPLHEFLPDMERLSDSLAELQSGRSSNEAPSAAELRRMGELESLIGKVRDLRETNPMMGQRGCRLGIVFPEIYAMQLQAIFRAAKQCLLEGVVVKPSLMVPLVGHVGELRLLREQAFRIATEELGEHARRCPFTVGTMIEVPRAALTAGQLAAVADFFSFGTNDLTQMTLGFSRDDAEGKFLN
ncbi:MAG: pyruvate phosphate dikinase, partial [Paenibacillaceae bacterium]|nr:pyruvate phosphate dikinase [Paenibacillaceae bacterium]